jgi:hypothetical protein
MGVSTDAVLLYGIRLQETENDEGDTKPAVDSVLAKLGLPACEDSDDVRDVLEKYVEERGLELVRGGHIGGCPELYIVSGVISANRGYPEKNPDIARIMGSKTELAALVDISAKLGEAPALWLTIYTDF